MSRWDGCEICMRSYSPVPHEDDMGENSEPITFSKNPCHMNESKHCHLAGERHIIHTSHYRPHHSGHEIDDNYFHSEVCPDCYLKHHGLYEEQNDD